MKNVKNKMDITFDHRAPSIVIKIPQYYDGYKEILKKGAKIRCITEITKENVQFCKDLLKIVSELRHLDGLKGGIAINESEYMATTILYKEKPLTEVIYSNVEEVVEQGQYIFDTLWNNAIPGIKKIKEIEQGVIIYETKILTDSQDLMENEVKRILYKSTELNICTSASNLDIVYTNYFSMMTRLMDRKKRGLHKGIRALVEINKDNLNVVKTLVELGIDLKHLKKNPLMNFGLTNSHLLATMGVKNNNSADSVIYSNDPQHLEYFKNLFENLWNESKDVNTVIKSIDQEKDIPFIETIEDPQKSLNLIRYLITSAKYEILIILSTWNSFYKQVEIGMIWNILSNIALNKNIYIKILVTEEISSQKRQQIDQILCKNGHIFKNKNENNSQSDFEIDDISNLNIRAINSEIYTEIGLITIDKNKSIILETMDNFAKNTSYIGLASFSNSINISKSYAYIFDSLWNQTETYNQLKKVHEELQIQDKMQEEFIDIVAHELRTPLQPILGFTEHLKVKIKDKEQIELLNCVISSAKKLQNLTENILDVTRIGSKLFNLNKEYFDINNLILDIVKGFESSLKKNKHIRFEFTGFDTHYLLYADKSRIRLVISNLIDNSINFISDEGIIAINIEKKTVTTDNTYLKETIVINVKDNGEGINDEIMTRLFTKFTSKSSYGTGLGLYICKNIIESHGGQIWATNNKDGKGALFSFSLPLNN